MVKNLGNLHIIARYNLYKNIITLLPRRWFTTGCGIRELLKRKRKKVKTLTLKRSSIQTGDCYG